MTRFAIVRDEDGATAVEFAITFPFVAALLFGIIEVGLLIWVQLGLQHGAEMAARCATVNPSICSDLSSIQKYAAQQAFGVNPPPAVFTVTTPACGNQVNASYAFESVTSYVGLSQTINAQACFPK